MGQRDDAFLIEQARRGSADALAALFERYWPVAWRTAYAITRAPATAEDVAQEGIERAFASLERFERGRLFEPWLKRIVANRAIDELRRARSRGEAREQEVAIAPEPISETPASVAAAVLALPTEKRVVVVLRYWLDLSLEEIAAVVAAPVGTVASRLSRALDDLRCELEGCDVA